MVFPVSHPDFEGFARCSTSEKKSLRAKELYELLFSRARILPERARPLISGHAMGSIWMAGDYSSLYRSTQDSIVAYLSQLPSGHPWRGALHAFSGTDVALGYHAFGTVTGINAILGAVKIKHSFDDIAFTEKIRDSRGNLKSKMDLARSVTMTGAGLSFAVFRPLGMISAINKVSIGKGFNSATLLGRVTFGAVFLGLMFYAIFFILLSAMFGIDLYEGESLRRKLNAKSDLAGQLQLLQSKFIVNLDKVRNERQTLISEAMGVGKRSLKALLIQVGVKSVSDEKLEEMITKIIETAYSEADPKRVVEKKLYQKGLFIRGVKLSLKKHAKLSRAFGGSAFKALKKTFTEETHLIDRIKAKDAKAIEIGNKLVAKVREGLNFKRKQSLVLIALCLFGVLAMVTNAFLLSGVGFFIAAVLMLLSMASMLGVDGYFLLQSYKSEQPAAHDKKVLVLSSLLCVSSYATVVGLALAGVMTLGVFPLIVMSVLAALWLVQNAITWKIMDRNENRFKENNPTLETLLEALSKKKDVKKMLANLPAVLKEQVEREKKVSKDLKESLIRVKETMHKMRQTQLETLQSLSPYRITPRK